MGELRGLLRSRLTLWVCIALLGVMGATSVRSESDTAGFRRLKIQGVSVHWAPASAGQPIVLHYALASHDLVTPDAINCGVLQSARTVLAHSKFDIEAFRRAAAAAFERWHRVTSLTFLETSNQEEAEIVLGAQGVAQGWAYTNVTLGQEAKVGQEAKEGYRPITRALICLNPEKPWKTGFDGNLTSYDIVHTLTHEIGHAIGLDHPSARGHLMSFLYDESRDGLTAGDIQGAVEIYGPAETAIAGSAEPNASDDNTVGASAALELPSMR